MFDLIAKIAGADERVRAVYINGSRVNPHVKKDIFQDYDIVFVVTETTSFLQDKNWITLFGEIAMVQEPDSQEFGWDSNHDATRSYGWLMLFKDGNRIDLHIMVKAAALENYYADSLTRKLLDKDNFLPEIPPANDTTHRIQLPEKQSYLGCCNEFWWCLNNVAKGIARNQMPYAMRMYTEIVHTQLDRMVEWHIATHYDFTVSTGLWGKYFREYLPLELYDQYEKTYSDCDSNNLWDSVFTACQLFRILAVKVSDYCGYEYNREDDKNMMAYLNAVKGDSFSVFSTFV